PTEQRTGHLASQHLFAQVDEGWNRRDAGPTDPATRPGPTSTAPPATGVRMAALALSPSQRGGSSAGFLWRRITPHEQKRALPSPHPSGHPPGPLHPIIRPVNELRQLLSSFHRWHDACSSCSVPPWFDLQRGVVMLVVSRRVGEEILVPQFDIVFRILEV